MHRFTIVKFPVYVAVNKASCDDDCKPSSVSEKSSSKISLVETYKVDVGMHNLYNSTNSFTKASHLEGDM